MPVKFISNCRYITSPFSNLEDLSWRLLLRKYGINLCYTPLLKACDLLKETTTLQNKLFGHSKTDEDRPLIVQLSSDDPDILIEAVNGLNDDCDAVDISFQNSDTSSTENEQDKWDSWLQLIRRVNNECETSVACKLPFSQNTVDETIRKGNLLQQAGCQLLLLHKCKLEKMNYVVTQKDWESVKIIREAVSLPLILDVGSSSWGQVHKCMEYTGVQGIALAGSLESNPAMFNKKQTLVSEVVEQYLNLCDVHPTPLSSVKEHLNRYCGYYLSRFHNIKTNMADVETFEDVRYLMDQLRTEFSLLSKGEMKSMMRLKEKKESFKIINGIKRQEKQELESVNDTRTKEKEENHIPKIIMKRMQHERVENAMKNNGQKMAIDFSLSEEMSNKEVTKLALQVQRLYGANMKSESPVHMHFTGLNRSGRVYGECARQSSNFDNFKVDMSEKSFHGLFDPQDVVYLTPDSPHVLDQLSRDKVYIIGGLVDHQVRKNKTWSRAETANIATARLPINEYMERTKEAGNFSFSKVLTVNQVFDILLKFHETQDWPRALTTSIPPRKGLVLRPR